MTRRLVAILTLFSAFLAVGRMMPPPALNPKDYPSPSGEFILTVDPSDMYGRGPATYRVTRKGNLVWSREKPFTLYDAGITDKGIIAGYAYTHGIQGHARARGEAGLGDFHVVLMGSTGQLILYEMIPRMHSRFFHEYPNPTAKGIQIDGAKNQAILLINDPDVNRRQDVRWIYQLSSGRLLGKSTSGPDIPPRPAPPEPKPVRLPNFPSGTLKHLATVTLAGSAPSNDVRNIEGFDFDDRGRIGFVRRDTPSQRTFVLISVEGKILRDVTIPLGGELAKHGSPQAAWLAGERWVVVASGIGVGAKASAWWLDAANAEFEPVAGFDCPTIERVAGLRDGGFVALATRRLRYSREDSLIAFDTKGGLRWQIKEGQAQVETSLFSPEDVTVTTGGQIAVIDVIRKRVQFFNMNGKFLSVIALETAWKRRPNYPSTISADRDDGLLIKDFRGNPPIVRMDRAGSVVGEFFPKHPDGRIIDAIGGIRVDSSGAPWVCDGQALIRLRADGVSDRILGAAPSTEKLGRIAAVTVNQQGRIYAMDDRTGAVHTYDDAGAWLGVCKPDVTDFTDKIWDAQVAVRSDGTVFARAGTTRFVQFAPDRHRLGVKRIDVDTVTQHWYPLPNRQHTLIVGYHDVYIVDGAGEVIRTIQRRPNRKWLEQPRGASVAPDGSFAITTGGGYAGGKPWEVHLYTDAAEPIRTIEMPNVCMSSFFVYTGKVLVTRTDQDICVFTLSGAPLLKSSVALPGFADVNQRWQCFAPGARELWLVCAERKSVSRFELPKSED